MYGGSINISTKSYLCINNNNTKFLAQSLLPNKQQWRFFNPQSREQLCKIKAPKVYPNFYGSSFPSRPLSTKSCSSNSSKVGLLGWYLGKIDSHPFLTKSLTTSFIFAAADLTAQIITEPSFGSFKLLRTVRMASYGFLLLGPSQHLWFNFLSKALPNRDVGTTLKKIFIGQAIYGPCSNTIFYSYNAALQGESKDEIKARLKRDLLPTLKNGLMYWPICDFVTFKFVPVHLQPLVNSSCAYLWTIYLTYMATLKVADT